MSNLATIRMSSKGQIVIPESIRNQLELTTDSQFIILASDDSLILKLIQKPSLKAFDDLLKQARKQAKAAGLKRSDITKAIKQVRNKK